MDGQTANAELGIRMSDKEIGLLRKNLEKATHYLEFGCGGSTALAARSKLKTIASVENSLEWIDKCRADSAISSAEREGRLKFIAADTGPTKGWGYPVDKSSAHLWQNYYLRPWDKLDAAQLDLVLVDGRWRVACVMQAIVRTSPACRILVHDWSDKRPQYEVLLRFTEIAARAGSLVQLRPCQNMNWRELAEEMPRHLFQPK